MTKSKLYLALQAVVCVALVALLSASAISIYREGTARKAEHPLESVYTPENAAQKFTPIAPLLFAGIGLLIAGLVLNVKDENAEKPVKDAELSRDLIATRVAQPSEAMIRERRLQKKMLLGGWIVFALCMAPILVFLLNPNHFPQDDLEGMFFGLMRVFLPWSAVGLGALAVSSVLREKSILRETQAAQAQQKEEKATGIAAVRRPVDPPKKTAIPQMIIVVAAVVLIIAGVLNGSALDVLYKAITICTECVGLG